MVDHNGGVAGPLVTILTPTFNDERYLPVLMESVLAQTHANWQWIIVDDGSTDATPTILGAVRDPRIVVLRKENGDQLNALRHALPHVRGELVTMIHSDDAYVSTTSLADCVAALQAQELDGLYADFRTIDGEGHPTGWLQTLTTPDGALAERTVVHMGCNFLGDPFFVKRAAFDSHVVRNYIQQNTIYYFAYDSGEATLRLKKVSPWYAYRVFSENYIHSDIGKFVALSGQFRTVSRLINAGTCPALNVMLGYAGFRVLRKLDFHRPLPLLSPAAFGARFFACWRQDIARHGYPDILARIAAAIAHSYRCSGRMDAPLRLAATPEAVFEPADARAFFKALQAGSVPAEWLRLLECDFDHVVAGSEADAERVGRMLRFFSLQYPVRKA